jgi:hypothetical protein
MFQGVLRILGPHGLSWQEKRMDCGLKVRGVVVNLRESSQTALLPVAFLNLESSADLARFRMSCRNIRDGAAPLVPKEWAAGVEEFAAIVEIRGAAFRVKIVV